MVGRRVSQALTVGDAQSYLSDVKEAFHDEPSKYQEFINILNGIRELSVDKDSIVERVEELLEDHQDLLHGFHVFLPDEAKRNKHPHTKKKHADVEEFMNNLKTRFKSLDKDVVATFCVVMTRFKEGRMSVKELQEEVIDTLYYHEDLIEEFLRVFKKKKDFVISAAQQLHDEICK
ncbi:PREDICTED: paired amphipathic helix protein Sin3-like 3 [Camelina sativa]|uniref:Paired amphipathic helix protein Sin3-like 3 n=1 Tax=Camelina sativa TaxID=90675 RepID=A0ABM0VRT7_CAMSA|nr:PREDICTED: paired amphipathic helix protein Sin3-like 3 [Camelina sativa]XP_010460201.1 PREDICTED: paired amphipathic helix protein Sin3-like 3 [Camelina sativa]